MPGKDKLLPDKGKRKRREEQVKQADEAPKRTWVNRKNDRAEENNDRGKPRLRLKIGSEKKKGMSRRNDMIRSEGMSKREDMRKNGGGREKEAAAKKDMKEKDINSKGEVEQPQKCNEQRMVAGNQRQGSKEQMRGARERRQENKEQMRGAREQRLESKEQMRGGKDQRRECEEQMRGEREKQQECNMQKEEGAFLEANELTKIDLRGSGIGKTRAFNEKQSGSKGDDDDDDDDEDYKNGDDDDDDDEQNWNTLRRTEARAIDENMNDINRFDNKMRFVAPMAFFLLFNFVSYFFFLFSCGHATLSEALTVRPSVRNARVEKWENAHFRPCPPVRNWWLCIRPCFH